MTGISIKANNSKSDGEKMTEIKNSTEKKQVKSDLFICFIITVSLVMVLPMSAPNASAYGHMAITSLEDSNPLYDEDGVPVPNFFVLWCNPLDDAYPGEDHIFTQNYLIDGGYTVSIPGLDYFRDYGEESIIYFMPGFASKIDVYGTLITNVHIYAPFGEDVSKTLFLGEDGGWDGIYFHMNGQGRIIDCRIRNSANGTVFEPGSGLTSPGIEDTIFDEMRGYGVQMDGVSGYTYMSNCKFDDRAYNASVALTVANGSLNATDCSFLSHADNMPQVAISNADVSISDSEFQGYEKPGNLVFIEGNSDGTELDWCFFRDGAAGDYFIRVDGASPLIENCTLRTEGGSLSVIANDDSNGDPAHPILLQPNWDGTPGMYDDSFDNTTIDATGDSSVTIQWYMDVFVQDPKGNPMGNVPVTVKDRNGDPADPAVVITDANGWARWIKCKELTKYSTGTTYYSPFNVSATANGMVGYADPEVAMNVSKEVVVTVPFNPSNILPNVTWITTPVGVQTGYVTVNYELFDPDLGDNGNLSVEVFYSTDGKFWEPATLDLGSSQTTFLSIDETYTIVWDSEADMPNEYNSTVSILIVPSDRSSQGIAGKTGYFTVDNKAPEIISGPFITSTNTTALIEWTASEPSNATVSYGFWDSPLTNEIYNTSWTTYQTVTLTDLQPGRQYNYTIQLTDSAGHEFISMEYTFKTDIYIPLYKGWNMISLPPFLLDGAVEDVLASIAGQYDMVQAYDANDPADPWECYNIYKPKELNDLHQITPFKGLWIHVLSDTMLIPDHNDPSTEPMFPGTNIHLSRGWNYVGYPSVETRTVTDALSGIDYNLVQTYDAASGQWYEYDGTSGGLMYMEMGRGYWIHTDTEQTWFVPYA